MAPALGPRGPPLIVTDTKPPMALETAPYINSLDPANPSGPDRIAQGDDHIRLVKQAIKATFPNITGPVTATQSDLNALGGLSVPAGVISLWFGSAASIPAGYKICDGTLGTPDMRGKVPLGADPAHVTAPVAVGALVGQNSKTITTEVAGAHTHLGATAIDGAHTHSVTVSGTALTEAQMPSHKHLNGIRDQSGGTLFTRGTAAAAVSGPSNVESNSATGNVEGYSENVGGGQTHTHTASIPEGGAHAHAVAISEVAAHAHAATVNVQQASLALHYIMKV